MSGRENPVTRPSVFRTQDVQNGSFGNEVSGAAFFAVPYAPPFTLHSYALAEHLPRPLPNPHVADSLNRFHRLVSPNSPPLSAEGLQRQPSVRTFSQLSAADVPLASPTSAFFSADVSVPGWAEYNRTASISPGESPINAPFGQEMLLQRPLGPDTVREAVYAYLEATDRHDVVMAMLADERLHTQRGLGAAQTTAISGDDASAGRRAANHRVGNAFSTPNATSQVHSAITSMSGVSGSVSQNPLYSPPRDSPTSQTPGTSAALPGGQDGKRGRQRRSHDLLRRGLLDRRAAERHHGEEHETVGTCRKASPDSSPRRGAAGATQDRTFRPSSPAPEGGISGVAAASAPATTPHFSKPGSPANQRQHLPRILPTLCGLEEAVRPDLILLFSDLEKKINEQYRHLNIPPPSHEVLQYILTQAYEPMWSVGEDANVYHLFQPANPVTGMVLYGTLNQMVEQLTQVHVMPLSTPPDVIVRSERAFCQAFLRRHRLLMPSHVLLAKLMERYLVPLSLRLGFERFKVHGITVHVPGLGTSLPPRRSQSETVLHGRRHPGGAASAAEASGLWGSRTARQPPPGSVAETGGLKRGTSAAVEEYVRATAAATSPDAALIAMVRSGMLPGVTSDAIAALTNATIGTAPASTLTSNPTSTTLPHRGALGGFPNAAAAAGVSGLGGVLNGGGSGGTTSRPGTELVTTYSPSAALWLSVCEKVQLKVLSVLLYWLQHHPHHFDGEMLRSVLHFVENCCYGTCEWADCPSRQPQIAEFIRQACHAALSLSSWRLDGTSNVWGGGVLPPPPSKFASAHFAAFPPISKEWRDGVLSGTWERRRYQLLLEAIPPSLRHSVKAELLPWTWITPMGSLSPRQYLPCFAFRTLPTADAMSYPGEDRHQQHYQPSQQELHRSVGAATTTQAPSDMRGNGGDVTQLHAAAQEALRLFGSCTFETYVRGLTAAHYRMFTAFPSQDIFTAAQHTNTSYLTSPAFQSSFLGRFLNSSAFLTSWCVSLLLHAAYLDGERAAAVVAVTNMSILNSFVGDMVDYRAQATSEGDGEAAVGGGDGGGGSTAGQSRSSSVSLGNSTPSTASAATASAAAVSQNGTTGGNRDNNNDAAGSDAAAAAAARRGAFFHNPARQFLHVLDRIVDLVVGFLRVNNLHASYSVFRGFSHPFVRKLLQHRRINAHIHAQTAHRIRKLEGFFTSIPLTFTTAASASQSISRAGSTTVAGAGGEKPPSAGSAAAAAGVGDPTVDDDLDGPGNDGNTEAGPASPMNEVPPRHTRKAHHSFFEYLNTVPDSVEYPTVPVVQYYLRELQMMFALEPTFFTVPSHQMQSRFVSEEVRLTGDFAVPNSSAEEQIPAAASPIVVVNWRKIHLVDDWIQRVNSNQMSCLHYISSRSTVVRHIMPDLEFEKSFDEQLSRVVVTNTTLLQEMANQLYSIL